MCIKANTFRIKILTVLVFVPFLPALPVRSCFAYLVEPITITGSFELCPSLLLHLHCKSGERKGILSNNHVSSFNRRNIIPRWGLCFRRISVMIPVSKQRNHIFDLSRSARRQPQSMEWPEVRNAASVDVPDGHSPYSFMPVKYSRHGFSPMCFTCGNANASIRTRLSSLHIRSAPYVQAFSLFFSVPLHLFCLIPPSITLFSICSVLRSRP